jgi:hypothetical protein
MQGSRRPFHLATGDKTSGSGEVSGAAGKFTPTGTAKLALKYRRKIFFPLSRRCTLGLVTYSMQPFSIRLGFVKVQK